MGGRLPRAALLLLAFSPALATAALVWCHAVDVPFWDDWERAPLIEASEEGTLGFAQLYAPHIDHRMVFPRLVMLLSNWLGGGDLRWENAWTFAVVLATALACFGLLKRTLGRGPRTLLGAAFLANALLFSPLQWENFLWAVQLAFVIPLACLCAALLVLQTRLRPAAKLTLALLAALVGSHSFSHGLLIWPAVFGVWWLRRDPSDAAGRRGVLALWLLAAAAVAVPYVVVGGYRTATSHAYVQEAGELAPVAAHAGAALARPRATLAFAASMLGSPLARALPGPAVEAAPGAGLLVLGLFLAPLAWVAARRRDAALWNRALPWAALGGAAVVICGVVAAGRAPMVYPGYALVPRYTGISLHVLVAGVALHALVWQDVRERTRGAWRAAAGVAPGLLAALLVAVLAHDFRVGVDGMGLWRQARLHARTSLVFIDHFEPRYPQRLDFSAEAARAAAHVLDRYGYLEPPLARDARLAGFSREEEALPRERASIDGVWGGSDRVVVRGRALLPGRGGREAHGVLLTVPDAGGEPRVVALAECRTLRREPIPLHDLSFNEVEVSPVDPPGRWKAEVPLWRLPSGPELEIEVWAVDAERMRVYRVGEGVRVQRSAAGAAATRMPR